MSLFKELYSKSSFSIVSTFGYNNVFIEDDWLSYNLPLFFNKTSNF